MKKILLIDDRTNRQVISCNKIPLKISDYADVVENAINDEYEECFKQLQNDKFKADKYSAIITHKSAYEDENKDILYKIESLCKKHHIPLVFFSGGISVNHYIKSDDLEKLELNSKVLYSNNLKLFLEYFKETDEIELMILTYGKSWKLNILLNILEKTNLFVAKESNEDIVYDDFVNVTDFHLLKKVLDDKTNPLSVEKGWVTLSAIKEYVKMIENIAQERILHER